MTRREIREKVFKILFALPFNSPEEMEEQVEMSFATYPDDDEEGSILDVLMYEDKDKEYIKKRVLDITAHVDEIDKIIDGISEGWKLNRIGKAELAILRLAIYEIKYDDDSPEKVAINEAIELTKLYCDEEARKFINALLGKLV